MHQFLESVRNEIEAAAGQEAYLASALFTRIYKAMPYEDDGKTQLTDKEGFEEVQNRIINILHQPQDFKISDEFLSWQAAVLRHLARDFHHYWVEYKQDEFSKDDIFADGESCMALEASCERIKEDPTENYAALLEVERLFAKLATCPNEMITELERFWNFKAQITAQGEGINPFTEKRIAVERNQSLLAAGLRSLHTVSERCNRNARQLAGGHHLLWINAHILLEGFIQALDSFLEFEKLDNLELSLNHWLDLIFPARMKNRLPNRLYMSSTHQEVIARFTQATQCMVQTIVHGKNAFAHRDQIIIPHILEAMERVKRLSLQNISALQQSRQDQARS